MGASSQMRIAVKVSNRRFVMLGVGEVYYFESEGHDVLVRTARKTRLRSVRSLGKRREPRPRCSTELLRCAWFWQACQRVVGLEPGP